MDLLDLLGQLRVAPAPFAWLLFGATPAVVGGGGDGQFPENGLGPEVRMLINERQDLRRVGSSSEAKKADAVRRISFARRSWLTSRRRAVSSSFSEVVSRSSRSP